MGCYFLLQGSFTAQGSSTRLSCLLHCFFTTSACCGLSRFSCVQLFAAPWTVACQASLSMGFSRQEYWNGLPFPSPGNHPSPGIKPWVSCIAGRLFTIWASRARWLNWRGWFRKGEAFWPEVPLRFWSFMKSVGYIFCLLLSMWPWESLLILQILVTSWLKVFFFF